MKEIGELRYQKRNPENHLSDFVKCFWELENTATISQEVTILPDGYFDILFSSTGDHLFKPELVGLATGQAAFQVPGKVKTYAISFKLPAAEYILKRKIGLLIDKTKALSDDFWGINDSHLCDFETFINSVTKTMTKSLPVKTDARKLSLFKKLYQTDGAIIVEEIAGLIGWKSRQINRYFQDNFGLSLKSYCNILRFRASFDQLRKGQHSAVEGYFDQPHFIREVNKFAGTSPKHLASNEKDRFIQLSTLNDD